MSRTVHCVKLGADAEGLDRPPMPGPLGQRIYENVSRTAWQQWIEHQTRLINEYRLVLSDASARKFLSEELQRYFFGSGETTQTGFVPPPTTGNS
ncbi:oxidative damage protection protein [Pseudomonas sp.]|uniref:oxidative damage protection protein n=1 Tax=Pseudomonas sp. TaxID=306 RepID=UPI00333E5BE4